MTSHVGTIPAGFTSYFQVNNGVLYFLDYVEDIYIMILFVLVSILNPNHMYLPLPLTVYCNTVYYVVALSSQPM